MMARLAIVVLLVLAPLSGAVARELVRDGNVVVHTEATETCGPTARVTVHAGTPDVFQAGSSRLQRLVDAAQAVLRYECRELDSLHVEGRLAGLGEAVYDGVANAVDDWVLQTHRSVSADEVPDVRMPGATMPDPAERAISVASVKLGMGVDTVRRHVNEVFGADPVYDPQEGILRLDRVGCPGGPAAPGDGVDYRKPGANCVTAWFTDRRLAAMYRFRYTQSADGAMDEVRKVLVENFGEPRDDSWNEDGQYRSLVWTAPAGGDAITERLEARLFRDSGATVIDIVLADPRLAGGAMPAARAGQTGGSGVELKL